MFLNFIRYVIVHVLLLGHILAQTSGTSCTPARSLRIGILRHLTIQQAEQENIDTYAEKMIMQAAIAKGHFIEFINPLHLTCDIHATPVYDVILSRAEIDSFTNALADAYLRALDYFEAMGIPVINDAHATLNAQDKLRTLLLAGKAGVPVPFTCIVYSLNDINKLICSQELTFPFFVKKPYGGCGHGVFLVDSQATLQSIISNHFHLDEPILVEERIDLETDDQGNVKDMRIWVARNPATHRAQFIGGVSRTAATGNYLTNVSAGGSISSLPQPYDPNIIHIAEQALEAIGGDVAGVDIARDRKGNIYLLEVNISFYTSKAVYDMIGINIWELVIDLAQERVVHQAAVSRNHSS